jgi:hypothetical protein
MINFVKFATKESQYDFKFTILNFRSGWRKQNQQSKIKENTE